MIEVDVELEEWPGSPVIRPLGGAYARKAAEDYTDAPARLTPRQGVFYRNLIRLAEAVGGRSVPVDFRLPSGDPVYLDRGCLKIAEHAGFIAQLRNDRDGVVSSVTLAWDA